MRLGNRIEKAGAIKCQTAIRRSYVSDSRSMCSLAFDCFGFFFVIEVSNKKLAEAATRRSCKKKEVGEEQSGETRYHPHPHLTPRRRRHDTTEHHACAHRTTDALHNAKPIDEPHRSVNALLEDPWSCAPFFQHSEGRASKGRPLL